MASISCWRARSVFRRAISACMAATVAFRSSRLASSDMGAVLSLRPRQGVEIILGVQVSAAQAVILAAGELAHHLHHPPLRGLGLRVGDGFDEFQPLWNPPLRFGRVDG